MARSTYFLLVLTAIVALVLVASLVQDVTAP